MKSVAVVMLASFLVGCERPENVARCFERCEAVGAKFDRLVPEFFSISAAKECICSFPMPLAPLATDAGASR